MDGDNIVRRQTKTHNSEFENEYIYLAFACYEWTTEQAAQVASLSFPEKKKTCEDQGPEYKWSQVGQNQSIKLKSKV